MVGGDRRSPPRNSLRSGGGKDAGGGRRSEIRAIKGDGGRSGGGVSAGGIFDDRRLSLREQKILLACDEEKRPLVYVRSPTKAGKRGSDGSNSLDKGYR
ncbi:hypothetical protein MA16_Dca025168 [Dendrobium catenatum]|uniref:Uncharacterized protein n=1 Tax=Dendrobium catenatum TaxID=906689 RepID=A0A2I0VIG6_9ASPA|nr:hypothetical protein MA16_Dca025168 [Dendrobium catenatum]